MLAESTRKMHSYTLEVPVYPWMMQEILDILKTKDYYYRKWKHNKNNILLGSI